MQKTERQINWSIYVIGFIISTIIFGAGFWLGSQIEKSVSESLQKTIGDTRSKITSIETMLILQDDPAFCSFFLDEISNFDKETYALGTKIGYMEERKDIDPQLKADYMALELRDYFLAKKINSKCGSNASLVLYFLSSSSCSTCRAQGNELTSARQQAAIRVYSFDIDINSSLVNSLVQSQSIKTYPTLVINDKKYEGYVTMQAILDAVKK